MTRSTLGLARPVPDLFLQDAGRFSEQQPDWSDDPARDAVMRILTTAPALVHPTEIISSRAALARVAMGQAQLLQAGDCAESFRECTPAHVESRVRVLNDLADQISGHTGRDVVRIGRIAGQFAKPRSARTEIHDGQELPVFRGHMINGEQASVTARRHDPRRMLHAYLASERVLCSLARHRHGPEGWLGPWTSHEALVLDYEVPQLRHSAMSPSLCLTSTHLPWVGERSRQADGPHVRMLAQVVNPVALKAGPQARPEDIKALCQLLDPLREPGRLALIVRSGHNRVAEWLPPVARQIRASGHPVIWVCDPMHGNTLRSPAGRKTRMLDHIITEVAEFRRALERHGLHPGGLHLEVAAQEVTECLDEGMSCGTEPGSIYTTLCDPRLSPAQASRVAEAWSR